MNDAALCAECGAPRGRDGPCPRCGAAPEAAPVEAPPLPEAQWAIAERATWVYAVLSMAQRVWVAPAMGRWAWPVAAGSLALFAAVLWGLRRRSEMVLRGWTGFVSLGAALWVVVVAWVDPWQGAPLSQRIADVAMTLATAGCAVALRRAGKRRDGSREVG